MKKITLLIVFTFLTLLSFSQTVYQLDHVHRYTWANEKQPTKYQMRIQIK